MIGVDIVKISRVQRAIKSARFVERVFALSEVEYAQSRSNPAQTFAGIFATKEAVVKAVGCGIKNLDLKAIEVLHDENGCPYAVYEDKRVDVSIAHDGGFAVAIALIQSK